MMTFVMLIDNRHSFHIAWIFVHVVFNPTICLFHIADTVQTKGGVGWDWIGFNSICNSLSFLLIYLFSEWRSLICLKNLWEYRNFMTEINDIDFKWIWLFLSILVLDERARDEEKGSRESRWLGRTKGTHFGIPTIFTVYINIREIQEG